MPHTVTFTTPEPVAEFPVLISNKFTNIVAEGATHEDLRLKGNGTGPFMQEQFEPNAPVRILRKNPNYWDAGKPKADCIRVTVAQEPVAAVSAIKAGQVDLVLNVDPSIITALQDDPNVELLETGASNSMTVSMWIDTPPFDDIKVRQALKMVVDRQAMLDTVLLGFGETGADSPVPLPSPAAHVSEAPAQDIEGAKQLLAEAGHPDGLSFDLFTAEGVPGMVRMAQVFAEMAKPAGFNINVVVTPAESFWDEVWLKKPIVTSAWSMRPPGRRPCRRLYAGRQVAGDALEPAGIRRAAPEGEHHRRHRRAQRALPGGGPDARRRGRRHHSDVRSSGAGAAQGLHGLRAARAELQPELRKPLLRIDA